MNRQENGLNVQVIEGNWHRNNHAFANASGVGDFFRNNADTLLGGSFKLGEAWITSNAARDIARAQNDPNNMLFNNNGMLNNGMGMYVPPAPARSNTGIYVVVALAVVGIGVGVYMYSRKKAA